MRSQTIAHIMTQQKAKSRKLINNKYKPEKQQVSISIPSDGVDVI